MDELLCIEVDEDEDEGGDRGGGGMVFSDGVRGCSGLSSGLKSSTDDLALETTIEDSESYQLWMRRVR